MDFKIVNKNESSDFSVTQVDDAGEVSAYEVYFKPEQPCVPKKIRVEFQIPCINACSVWNPQCGLLRNILPDWKPNHQVAKSSLASGLPIQSLIAQDGNNVFTIWAADAKTPMEISCGVEELQKTCQCRVTFFSMPIGKLTEYRTRFVIDRRRKPFYEVIEEAAESMRTVRQSVPQAAKEAVYSTWYSFHQDIRDDVLIEECRKAYALGMRTIIVDDGWQTDNKELGYAYCGDWKLCGHKIKDMAHFVDAIHEIGMKIVFWYSVPYVGKKSPMWPVFRGKYLDNEQNLWNCLDPRFPQVREYLIGIYEKAAQEWKIDGFKLDFIDSFVLTPYTNTDSSGRDYESLEDAAERLLHDITARLRRLDPEVLLEFRQTYIGPVISQFGNMLRVNDCPLDATANRLGVLDLRLTSGRAAVHSDMITWNKGETDEGVAAQLIAALFGVPQISVVLSELSDSHLRVLRFWLDFWRKHRQTLLEGKLKLYNPEVGYSMAEAQGEEERICVCYSKNMVPCGQGETCIVNGTGENVIALIGSGTFSYIIQDCRGEQLADGVRTMKQVELFAVPRCGLLKILERKTV